MKRAVLSLGSNLQNREDYLIKSTELIGYRIGKVIKSSHVYETEAWGFTSFPFLNQVLVVETELTPDTLLAESQSIEKELGRTSKTKPYDANDKPQYLPRTIDIDILLFEDTICHTPQLTLPHPLIDQREFVLLPLSELFDNEVIPPFKHSFRQLLHKIRQSKVS